ncbi:MAG: amidohydrolase [Planctomycetes bacterium]|nr:amidohydrolase [Planctomycetota bacterium]
MMTSRSQEYSLMYWARGFTWTVLLALVLADVASAQSPSLQDVGSLLARRSVTTVYVAKSIITMDARKPRAEAVAVRDGRFVAVGTLAEVRAAVGQEARVDRTLADKIVSAGFIDQHVHPVLAALTMNTRVIAIEDWEAIAGFSPGVRDAKTYQSRLEQALREHTDRSQTFITWGYHHYLHGPLSRKRLDQLAPDFPVIVWHRSCHEFYLNSLALRKTGLDAALVAKLPRSAQAQIDLEAGHFFEQGALAVLNQLAPEVATPARFREGLEYTVRYYHQNGLTSCCEPGGFFSKTLQDMINEVYGVDATPFNHYFLVDGKTLAARNPQDPRAMVAESEQVLNWGQGRTAYLPKQVKLFCDGAIYSQLMMMKEGYTDGHQGAWLMDPPVFGYAFQGYWDAGYQIHIHTNGDAGFEVVLGELQKAMQRAPRNDHRTTIVHFGFAQPQQTQAWIELGGIVSSNPYYVTALAGPYEKIGLGPDRARNIAPHKYVLDHGGSLSFHSDMPMAPAKPLQLLWSGVNRLTLEGPVAGPEHRVPLDVALRAITINAAYSIRQEKEIGSIEVGKRANLTVLEKDPYEVPPRDLRDVAIWGTMLEGRMQPVPNRKTAATTRIPAESEVTQSQKFRGRWFDDEPRQRGLLGAAAPQTGLQSCGPGCGCRVGERFAQWLAIQQESDREARLGH